MVIGIPRTVLQKRAEPLNCGPSHAAVVGPWRGELFSWDANMSDTRVDMAKVTQMLDGGWLVQIEKQSIGSYLVRATHRTQELVSRANKKIIEAASPQNRDMVEEYLSDGEISTDDFTPQQALTRLAYKVHGEII